MNNFYDESNKEIIQKVCGFLKIDCPKLLSNTPQEGVKEICVARLCKSIGINCEYNYKTEFFEFFSSITAEAVCNKLNINLRIAPDNLRLFRYNKLNLIEEVKIFLDNENIDEAFIDAFDFVDSYKYLIPLLK